jgi:hypothetical protein
MTGMRGNRIDTGRLILLAGVAAALAGCAGQRLHGVGAVRTGVSPVAAILDDTAQSLGAVENAPAGQTIDFQSDQAAIPQEEAVFATRRYPPMPDMGRNRDEAVNEIRAKASAGSKAKPDIFQEAKSSAKPLSETEQERLTGNLDSEVGSIDDKIPADEVARKQAEAEWLKKRGRTHYEETLNEIEK